MTSKGRGRPACTSAIVAFAALAGAAGPKPQAKTHLGGKVDAIIELVQDCSSPAATCGSPRCATCAGCTAGSPNYPLCCPFPNFCAGSGESCTTDANCAPISCQGVATPQACLPLCSAGDRAGKNCRTASDCPHDLLQQGNLCPALPAGTPLGQSYTVPRGSSLLVTDVLTAGSVELSSDDKTTDAVVTGTQHFTAGLVFPAGSHVNMKGLGGGASVQLIGYLAKT